MKTINDYLDRYPSSFCPRPFQEMVLWYDRSVKICCVEEVMPNKEEVAPNFDIGEKYRSSPRMQKIRETMLQGKWPKECSRCKREEDRGSKSLRSVTARRKLSFYDKIIPSIEGAENVKIPLRVEFRIGNACNMKCRMCFPLVSSLIANELVDNLNVISKEEWAKDLGEYNLGAGSLELQNAPYWQEFNSKSLNWIEDSSIDRYMEELEDNLEIIKSMSEKSVNQDIHSEKLIYNKIEEQIPKLSEIVSGNIQKGYFESMRDITQRVTDLQSQITMINQYTFNMPKTYLFQ